MISCFELINYSLEKVCILKNERGPGGRVRAIVINDTWGRGKKYAKKVSRII